MYLVFFKYKIARDVVIESLQGELDEKERENKELKNDVLQQQQRMRQGWDTEKEQLIAKTAVLEAQGDFIFFTSGLDCKGEEWMKGGVFIFTADKNILLN